MYQSRERKRTNVWELEERELEKQKGREIMGVEFDLRENEWMKNKRVADWILRRTGRIPIERFEGSARFASLGDRGEAATGLAPIVIAGADAWAFAPRLHAEFIPSDKELEKED